MANFDPHDEEKQPRREIPILFPVPLDLCALLAPDQRLGAAQAGHPGIACIQDPSAELP